MVLADSHVDLVRLKCSGYPPNMDIFGKLSTSDIIDIAIAVFVVCSSFFIYYLSRVNLNKRLEEVEQSASDSHQFGINTKEELEASIADTNGRLKSITQQLKGIYDLNGSLARDHTSLGNMHQELTNIHRKIAETHSKSKP